MSTKPKKKSLNKRLKQGAAQRVQNKAAKNSGHKAWDRWWLAFNDA